MTTEQITQKLNECGLNKRYIAIYLSLLKQKDQTVFTLAKNVKLPRTTVYKDLESLKSMDMVGIMKKNGVAHWYAEHPRRLIKDAENKVSKMKEVFPELESMMTENDFNQPEVRFYIGKESIKDVIHGFYDILEKRDLRRLYTLSHHKLQEFFPKFLPEILKKKKDLDIFTYLIAPESTRTMNLDSYATDSHREVRYIPSNYAFTSTMIICDEHIALFSLKDGEVYTMTITSSSFATMFRAMFMFVWDTVGTPSKT